MWVFRCRKCGAQRKKLEDVPIRLYVPMELDVHGNLDGGYWNDYLPTDTVDGVLACPACGEGMEIKDVPCLSHEWGETKNGYGDFEGKVMRQCVLCDHHQIGTQPPPIAQDPVWDE